MEESHKIWFSGNPFPAENQQEKGSEVLGGGILEDKQLLEGN